MALTLAALMLCAAAVAAQRSASVATTFRQSTGEGSVEVGIVQVGDAAAGLSSISYAVCELLTATQFEVRVARAMPGRGRAPRVA